MGRSLETLSPRTRWLGRHRQLFEETDSTNLRAEELAEAGAADGTLVLADRQTAGRGRMGRSFFSPSGVGLYLSVILRPAEMSPEHAHRHVFAAAVAVASAVRAVPKLSERIEIKWPNDVLLAGRKTSGINLSVRLTPQGSIDWLVLGIGVNVNTALADFPPELRSLATSLAASSGSALDRTTFAEDLLTALELEIDALRRGDFPGVLARWRELFKMNGAWVEIGIAAQLGPSGSAAPAMPSVQGEVTGVDEEGALLLETLDGVRRIVAGDVTVLRREA
jgi:BirA family transcriptional regulator, biotin operon repressor / biotin---[acetyl-CoA-carboxylase] ligase